MLAIYIWKRAGEEYLRGKDAENETDVMKNQVRLGWLNAFKSISGMTEGERDARAATAREFIKNYKPQVAVAGKEPRKKNKDKPDANLDNSTLNLLTVSFQRPDGAALAWQLATKFDNLYVTETALSEYMVTIRDNMDYRRPDELIAAALILSQITVVADDPSERFATLMPHAQDKFQGDFTIFGTGDRLGAVTFTADRPAVQRAYDLGQQEKVSLAGWEVRMHDNVNLPGEAKKVAN